MEPDLEHRNVSATAMKHEVSADDFISLRDTIRMIAKHWRNIAAFTCVVTITLALIFLLMPRKYAAEAVLQVVMPEPIADQAPDRQGHEANVLSHLEYLKSSSVATLVAENLKPYAVQTSVRDLREVIEIERPPKTNLLRITAEAASEKDALAIVSVWRSEYLDLLSENNVHRAVLALQNHINSLQNEWLETSGKAEAMRKQEELGQTDKTVTLSKGIVEGELWRKLIDGADEGQVKRLSDIHFKTEEINEAYLILKQLLLEADQDAGSARYALDFYKKVLAFLQTRGSTELDDPEGTEPLVADYAKMLLEKRDIFPMGEPSPIDVRRGAAKKTAIVFVLALAASSLFAFTIEWMRDPDGQ